MTQPSNLHALQARRLAEVHHAAQQRMGLVTALVTYRQFASINPQDSQDGDDAAFTVLATVKAMRAISRSLARRYYNLARALGTATVQRDPDLGWSETVPLGQLYTEMADVLNEMLALTTQEVATAPSSVAVDESESPDGGITPDNRVSDPELDRYLDQLGQILTDTFTSLIPGDEEFDLPVTVEDDAFDWPDDLDGIDDELEALVAAELDAMEAHARKLLESNEESARVQRKVEDQLTTDSAILSGKLDKAVMDAGRSVIHDAGMKDGRRVSWIRVTTATPCHFCAMLASRGAAYLSRESALFTDNGDLYHPNCHCQAEPVFIDNPVLSEREQWFKDAWADEIRGRYSGKEALRQWRRFLREAYRLGLVPTHETFRAAA